MAGPFVDQTTDLGGGCYVLISETEDHAKSMASADPLVAEGLYRFEMLEWKRVVPGL